MGDEKSYEEDILVRYQHGEFFSQDSIKHSGKVYHTSIGRKVYSGGGYRMLDLDEHCQNPTGMTNIKGSVNPQHGSFLKLTEREYTHLETWEKVVNALDEAKKLQTVRPIDMLAEAISLGEQALNESGTFDEEYEAMQKAYIALQKALTGYDEYLRQLAAEGKLSDMTFRLQNPDFSQGGQGWCGTGFTAAPKIFKETCRIDFHKPAKQVYDFVRHYKHGLFLPLIIFWHKKRR